MSHLSAPSRRLSADALDPPAQNHVRPRYGSCGNIPIDIHRLILSSLLSAASGPSPAASSSCDATDRSSLVAYACSSKALAAMVLPELYRHVRLPLTEGSLISLLRAGLDASVLDLHAGAGARVIDVAGAYGQEEPLKAVLLRGTQSVTLVTTSPTITGNDSGSTGRTTESVPSARDPSYLDAVRTLQTAHGRMLTLSPACRIRIPTLIFSLSLSLSSLLPSSSPLPPPLAPTPSAPPVPRSRPSSANLPYTYLPIALHAALAHLLTALEPRRLVLAGPAMCLHLIQPIPWLVYRLAARVDEVVIWVSKTPEQVGADDDRPGEGYYSVLRMSGNGAEPDRVGIIRVLQEIGKAVGRWYPGGAVSTATPVMLDLDYDTDIDTDDELASTVEGLRLGERQAGKRPAWQRPAPVITIVLALPPNERYEPPGPPYSSMAMTMEFHPDYAPGWFHALCKAWATPFARLLLSHAEGAERSGAAARAEAWGRVRRQAGEQAGGEAQAQALGYEMVVEPAVTVQYNDDPPVQHPAPAVHHVSAPAPASAFTLAAQPTSTSRDHHTPSPPSPSPKPKSTTTGPLIRLVNFGALAGTSAGLPQASYTEIQDRLGRGLRVCIHRALHWSRHELGVGVGEGVDTRDEDGALVGRVEMMGMEGWLREQGGGGGRGGVDGDRESDSDRDRALDGQGGGGAGSAAGLSSTAEKRDLHTGLEGPEQRLAWMGEVDASLAAKYRAHLQPKVYW